ncbi:hypothetical protein EPI10_030989 [Gossypium australe]|uniref:Uncharacterized protein n=1 Tax=Gossypium australe TaxID=47621 RepID=A0A5B6WYX4_9ROSI|nr:hypothetical protein EPI10_030989 [Gossypium australe]
MNYEVDPKVLCPTTRKTQEVRARRIAKRSLCEVEGHWSQKLRTQATSYQYSIGGSFRSKCQIM